MSAPLVVSYGVGVDSTATLIEMFRRDIRPDLILFADTGGEKPETYLYLPYFYGYLQAIGFPTVTTVRFEPKRATYHSLEEKCLTNQTLPSLAFGYPTCSMVFKAEVMDKFVRGWQPALDAWEYGQRVVRAIGYDCGRSDTKRRAKADKRPPDKLYDYWYPLQDWGYDRAACEKIISDAGLAIPMKSACFFCPASTKKEILWLEQKHPYLYAKAVHMENVARAGKHGLDTVKGLGRRFSWADRAALATAESAEQLRP